MKFALLESNTSYNILFHSTKHLPEILSSNELRPGSRHSLDGLPAVCMSRSYSFVQRFPYIIALNKDMLKHNYKIAPISDFKNMRFVQARFDKKRDESKAEEVCYETITSLDRYIEYIIADDDKVSDLLNNKIKIIPKSQYQKYRVQEEAYLDSEEKFYDYRTGTITGKNLFDTSTTGMSFYNQFLNKEDAEYLKTHDNMVGNIVYMSPKEYYRRCAEEIFGLTVDKLKASRECDKNILAHLKDVITIYKKQFPIPFINYAENSQEGLHRMYVAGEIFGWDTEFPVLVITYADPEKAAEDKRQKELAKINNAIEKAINHTIRYKFSSIDEFKSQLQCDINDAFYMTSGNKEFTIEETDDKYVIHVEGGKGEIDKSEVEILEPVDDDDIDIDDIDLESDEDFLIRYFGKDWRTTHPHLKHTFNIK